MTRCIGPSSSMWSPVLLTVCVAGSGEVGGAGLPFLLVGSGFLLGFSATAGWIGSASFGALGPGVGSFFFGLPPGAGRWGSFGATCLGASPFLFGLSFCTGGWGSSGGTALGAGPFLFGLPSCTGGWGSFGVIGSGVGALFEVTSFVGTSFVGAFCGGCICTGGWLGPGTLAGTGCRAFGCIFGGSIGT